MHDSTFDRFQNWVHENADVIGAIADVAGKIAAGAALLGLAVSWIPVIGQALAAVLEIVALAAGVVALVGHLLLALSGDGSWVDVAVDVIGIATFGIGKVAGAAAKAAAPAFASASRGAAAARAATTAFEGAAAREGADLAAHGVRSADSALTMVTGVGRQAQQGGLREVLGVSGNAVDRMRAPTRAAWKAVDGDFSAAKAFAAARSQLGSSFLPTLGKELRATWQDATSLSWTGVRQAGTELRANGLVGNAVAATQGLRDTGSALVAAVAHPVATARAVQDVGSVLGGSGAAKAAASVVVTTGLAFDGIEQAVSDLTGWSQDHNPPTVGGTSKSVLEGISR